MVAVVAVATSGCGGPSAQDAEAHAEAEYESRNGIEVRSVYCEEGSGERFECDVAYRFRGFGETRTDQVLVDEADL